MKIMQWTAAAITTLFTLATGMAHASPGVLTPRSQSDSNSGITFSIAYTAGVHNGSVSAIKGQIKVDANDSVSAAHLEIPVANMTTSNATRDCHMRESLGIQYAGSQFPANHVCDANNQTPASGPDAVVFNSISFDFTAFQSAPSFPLNLGVAETVLVDGTITMHGVKKSISGLPVSVTKTRGAQGQMVVQLQGNFTVSLKDYGVVVKPANFGPVSITTSDTVKIAMNVLLSE